MVGGRVKGEERRTRKGVTRKGIGVERRLRITERREGCRSTSGFNRREVQWKCTWS